jgi:hypothetical protein
MPFACWRAAPGCRWNRAVTITWQTDNML